MFRTCKECKRTQHINQYKQRGTRRARTCETCTTQAAATRPDKITQRQIMSELYTAMEKIAL